MTPSLDEKRAFFAQLDACREVDDESDALSEREQLLKQQCKAFSLTAVAAAATLGSSPKQTQADSHRRRTASDPIPQPVDLDLEIIAVTHRITVPEATAFALVHGAATGDSVVPETEQPTNKRLPRGSARLLTRVLRSHSDIEQSPSVSMTRKRKLDPPLQLLPESQRIFKGLCFFYIPNDDLNPARKLRITKARERGATWVREPSTATHIIVDKGLDYHQIKPTLDRTPAPLSATIVNDQYPVDCWIRGDVFDPYQTIGRHKYKVRDDPGQAKGQTIPPTLAPQNSESPSKIKQRKDAKLAPESTPQSQRSSDLVPSSYPEMDESPTRKPDSTSGAELQSKSGSGNAPDTSSFTDELATCIDAVLDDPEKHEYLDENDPDASTSEDEGPRRKKGRGQAKYQKKPARTRLGEDKFMCMRGGTRDKKVVGPNSGTIKLLEEMAEEHRLSDETWRVQSYRKAVATLRRQPKKITTAKEASSLPNIGGSLADHIEEIATTGRFLKLENLRSEPTRVALRLFCEVYGAGVPTARIWVDQGYRTLDDLRTRATLTTNQQLGVDRYEDLLTRIPRVEVEALGNYVKDTAASLDLGVELIVGGSYRRGAESSGDIDFIVTKKGTSTTQELSPYLDTLVATLTKEGFLTAALATHRHDGGNKWHGCCVLPEDAFPGPKEQYRPIWRRVDFLLVPDSEIGAALLYFTGNDLFNRSMRLLARKRKMKLNHRALTGYGVHEGRDEKKIFEILGVKWREPHERWC
ncbi:hypothetical protein F4808DRAFT_433485 [Astrocystis sublimbata]|nr:hypothetical protein F4808DRAFT_433485 [Astrocystis sublimbata]